MAKENKVVDREAIDAEVKAKYIDVTKIVSGEYVAYLRKPNRYAMGAFMTKVQQNMVMAYEELYLSCVIPEYSDSIIHENDEIFVGTFSSLEYLIQVKKSHSSSL